MNRIKSGRNIDDVTANDAVQRAIAEITDYYDEGGDVKYYYVTSNVFTKAEKERIKAEKEAKELAIRKAQEKAEAEEQAKIDAMSFS